MLKQCFVDAQSLGEIHPRADVTQAVFEAHAMLLGGNFLFVLTNDKTPLAQSREGVDHVLARLAAGPAPTAKRTKNATRKSIATG